MPAFMASCSTTLTAPWLLHVTHSLPAAKPRAEHEKALWLSFDMEAKWFRFWWLGFYMELEIWSPRSTISLRLCDPQLALKSPLALQGFSWFLHYTALCSPWSLDQDISVFAERYIKIWLTLLSLWYWATTNELSILTIRIFLYWLDIYFNSARRDQNEGFKWKPRDAFSVLPSCLI